MEIYRENPGTVDLVLLDMIMPKCGGHQAFYQIRELDKDAKQVRVEGEIIKLTATEYGILQLLMESAGKVFSIDEIYEKVWNEQSFAPENTVSVHIRRIREKIEINPKEPRYLKVVWGIGYKIEKI